MQVKSIAECSMGAFCNTMTFIKVPFVIKIFVLSIFEWMFYTGFTVHLAKMPTVHLYFIHFLEIAVKPSKIPLAAPNRLVSQ